MPRIDVVVECPVAESFRVAQVAGLFDLPLQPAGNGENQPPALASHKTPHKPSLNPSHADDPRIHYKSERHFSAELPDLDEAWSIGAIVGPSGSGKTTIARQAYGNANWTSPPWPHDRAVIDGFAEAPHTIHDITQLLTAVGFGSPPAWIRPYHVLSGGERFRCDLARALADGGPLVVFDEFTSVVDRTVARFGSAAVAKAIRSGRVARRFIAVTCHYDVLEWLEPDWVLDMATCTLARGRLRRPSIELEVVRTSHTAWKLFGPHHYLSAALSKSARCYLALWEGEPVAMCALLPAVGAYCEGWRVSRIVTLPDYQGIGIGGRLLDTVGNLYARIGQRLRITTSHPAMIGGCQKSRYWRCVRFKPVSGGNHAAHREQGFAATRATSRATATFEYVSSESQP